jgi:hypothetical protein
MRGEFEKQIEQLKITNDQTEIILNVINSAGKEFPCLTCPSKVDCGTFKWFLKWFGEKTCKINKTLIRSSKS